MHPHVLIAGGYGLVGGHIARHLRRTHPQLRLTLAGRVPDAGAALAAELSAATVALDVNSPAAGLTAAGPADLIIAALHDPSDRLIDAAITTGAGHIGITRTVDNIAPTAFAVAHRQPRRAIVPLGHWQAGILTLTALEAARTFDRLDRIELTAVYDMNDPIGPLTAGDSSGFSGRALLRQAGAWNWAEPGDGTRRVCISGGEVDANPVGVLDLASLAAVTDAPDIRFDLAIATSIAGLAGQGASHDLYVDIAGTRSGIVEHTRTVLSAPAGQAHLTAFGVALAAERVLGLDGRTPAEGGFQPPENLLDPAAVVTRLQELGVRIEVQDSPPGQRTD